MIHFLFIFVVTCFVIVIMGTFFSKERISNQNPSNINKEENGSVYETDEGEEFVEVDYDTGKSNSNYGPPDVITDAAESRIRIHNVNISNPMTITAENVEYIENKLEFYEKVGLVFLLFDNVDVALQHLIIEESHEYKNQTTLFQNGPLNKTSLHLISTWARSKHTNSWQNQLIEALCIIQNFEILNEFGYDKQDMKIRFLPTNPYSSLFVNLTRKVLYIICESFTKDKMKDFLKYIHDDFKKKNITFQIYNENYLELYFFKLFSERYISENDLSNITKIFKQMGLDKFCDWLLSVENLAKNDSKIENHEKSKSHSHKDNISYNINFDINGVISEQNSESKNILNSDTSFLSDISFINNKLLYKDEECYKIDPANPGICLVINQRDFYKESDPNLQIHIPYFLTNKSLDRRDGTDVDRDRLKATFKKMNFTVKVIENCTHTEILKNIDDTMVNFNKKHSSLFICILSHGYEGSIFGVNTIPVQISKLEDTLLNCKYRNLLGKPKILILQSCQGAPLQEIIYYNEDDLNTTDDPSPSKKPIIHKIDVTDHFNVTDGIVLIPEKSDLLISYSTIPGYASIRNIIHGSWFIEVLCNVILKDGSNRHFLDVLSIVNNLMTQKQTVDRETNKVVGMVSELRSSFRKFLFLPVPQN